MINEEHKVHASQKDMQSGIHLKTGARFTVDAGQRVVVRLPIDPAAAGQNNETFTLICSNERFPLQTRTVKDDLIRGDQFIDLAFTLFDPNATYSLKTMCNKDSEPYYIFEDIHYRDLSGLSGSVDYETELDQDNEKYEDEDDYVASEPLEDELE